MNIQKQVRAASFAISALLLMALYGCENSGDSQLAADAEVAHQDMPEAAPVIMSELERIKQSVRDFKANQWDAEKSAAAYEVFAPDYVNLRNEFQNLAVNAEDPALQAIADSVDVAISGRQDRIEEMVAEGNVVGIQTRITGTHSGNLYGIPATGKSIDIVSVAFYTFEDGKIVEAWEMADEAALLRQIGQWLPERSDGQRVAPVIYHPVQEGSQVLVDILSNPEQSDTYANKVRVSAYKSQIRPSNQVFDGRPYDDYTRAGFFHVADRSRALGTNHLGMGQAFPDRVDMVGKLIAEGDKVMIQFLLTATNSSSLFGNLPSNAPVGAWEVGVHTFEGTHWQEGWWFGDDVGMMLQIGIPGSFLIPESE